MHINSNRDMSVRHYLVNDSKRRGFLARSQDLRAMKLFQCRNKRN